MPVDKEMVRLIPFCLSYVTASPAMSMNQSASQCVTFYKAALMVLVITMLHKYHN